MNKKNNVLTLISATTLICNVFSSYVNAKGYVFTSSNDMKPCEVITKNGKNVLSKVADIIDLGIMQGGEKKTYVFLTGEEKETEEVYSETDKMLKAKEIEDYKKKIEEAKDAIKNAGNEEEKAKAEKKAVEIAAELRGEYKDKTNSYELLESMRGLVIENSKMMHGIDAEYGVLGEGFKIEEMSDGEEDAANLNEALKMTLCTVAGAKPANHKFKIVVMGDTLKDEVYEAGGELAGHKEYKYKVLSTGAIDGVNKGDVGPRIEAAKTVAVAAKEAKTKMVAAMNVAIEKPSADDNEGGLQIDTKAGKAAKTVAKYTYKTIGNLGVVAATVGGPGGVSAARNAVNTAINTTISNAINNAVLIAATEQLASWLGKTGADVADGGGAAADKAAGAAKAVVASGTHLNNENNAGGANIIWGELLKVLDQVNATANAISNLNTNLMAAEFAALTQNNIANAIGVIKNVANALHGDAGGINNAAGDNFVNDGDGVVDAVGGVVVVDADAVAAIRVKIANAAGAGNAADAQIIIAAKNADVTGADLTNIDGLGVGATKLGVDFSTDVGAGVGGLTEVDLNSANLSATQVAISASVPITQAKADAYISAAVDGGVADADADAAITCRGDAAPIHNNNTALTTRKGTVGTQATGNNFHFVDNLFDGNAETVESQQKRFAKYAYEWFNFRAKEFMKAAEETKPKNVAKKQTIVSYLGAYEAAQNINKFGDYSVKYIAKKGGKAVTLNPIREQTIYLEDKKEEIKVLTVELIANSAEKDTEIEGVIEIKSNAQGSTTQEIEVRGELGKGSVEDPKNIVGEENIIINKTKLSKEAIEELRSERGEVKLNIAEVGNMNNLIEVIIDDGTKIKSGEKEIRAEIKDGEEIEKRYEGAAVLDVTNIAKGKIEYRIPLEMLEERMEGENNRYYIYKIKGNEVS